MVYNNCIVGASYTMKADFYKVTKVQDSSTGQIVRQWVIDEVGVPVDIRALANLRGKDSGTLEQYREVYELNDYVRVKSAKVFDESFRITNITTADGQQPWLKRESTEQEIFDVLGVSPVTDGFGNLFEYVALCNRSQDNSLTPGA